MSVSIVARLICDKCGASIIGTASTSSTMQQESYWNAMDQAHGDGWIVQSTGWGKRKHFCRSCADGRPGDGVEKKADPNARAPYGWTNL